VSEIAILHVCPHCQRVFDSPSVCVESGQETVPTPMTVASQQFAELTDITTPFEDEFPDEGKADGNGG
jgi:hypothetical protein